MHLNCCRLHPWKLTQLRRKIIFQTFMFGFQLLIFQDACFSLALRPYIFPWRNKTAEMFRFSMSFQNPFSFLRGLFGSTFNITKKWLARKVGNEWECSFHAWNLKHPLIKWMIPNLQVENCCLTKHPFKSGCLEFQVVMIGDKLSFMPYCCTGPASKHKSILQKVEWWNWRVGVPTTSVCGWALLLMAQSFRTKTWLISSLFIVFYASQMVHDFFHQL